MASIRDDVVLCLRSFLLRSVTCLAQVTHKKAFCHK